MSAAPEPVRLAAEREPDLRAQLADLQHRLEEARAQLDAIVGGAVDAFTVGPPEAPRVFVLQGAEAPYRLFVETMQEGAATVDAAGCILYANEALARLAGVPLAALRGAATRELFAPGEAERFDTLLQQGLHQAAQRELHLRSADGAFTVLVSVAPFRVGAADHAAVEVFDLRERDAAAEARAGLGESERARRALLSVLEDQRQTTLALQRITRTLKTLSAGNSALVHAANEDALYREMCRIAVETGGYRMAWIGLVQHDAMKTVKPMAWSGEGADYVARAEISWSDDERGRGPTGRCIREGRPQVVRDIATDPSMAVWREAATQHGYRSTVALPLADAAGCFGALTIYSGEPDAFDADALALLIEMAGDLAFGVSALRTRIARDDGLRRLENSMEATVRALASMVELRDPYTSGHQRRVADIASAIARELGWNDERVRGLHLAATIHDVGKINVPAEILAKPGRLSVIEYELVKGHAEAGYQILKGVEFPWPIAEMIRQHHERLDGSGYPRGLKGDAIQPEARIIAVADVVEAIASHRPYRAARGLDAALAEIAKGRGEAFDEMAVDACTKIFRERGFRIPE